MTGRAEVKALAGKGRKALVVVVFAFHLGKSVMQIAAIII
jgi:hypothetical protein